MTTNHQHEVSVIIPARNEATNIARVVRSLALQRGIREILVVDDQSTDGRERFWPAGSGDSAPAHFARGVFAGRLDGENPRRGPGAQRPRGDWLLFTDADTEHLAGSLAELLQRAEDEHADLLSLSPGQETPTWWEKSVIPQVFVKLASLFRFEEVSDPQSPAAAANGQYVLVRREIYERSGGHEAVKSAILEDVELARRIKSPGGKLLFLPGAQWVRTRMYQSFGEMWQGWTKNLYLLYGGNDPRCWRRLRRSGFWMCSRNWLLCGCLWLALPRAGGLAMLAAVGLFILALARQWNYGRALARLGFDPSLANYQPMGAALLGALMLGSLRAHRATGSIEWKGRHYATKGKG